MTDCNENINIAKGMLQNVYELIQWNLKDISIVTEHTNAFNENSSTTT